jgi:hypothetical protein
MLESAGVLPRIVTLCSLSSHKPSLLKLRRPKAES